MSNVVNDFTFFDFNTSVSYRKHDVVYGVNSSDKTFYYATQDTQGSNPRMGLSYAATTWERTDDLTTVFFTKTGAQADFVPGSLFIIASTSQPAINFTGVAIDAGANYVKYLNPGWPQGNTALTSSTVSTFLSPAWTSGFGWVPSNATTVDFMTKRDFAQFGDGYTQQSRLGINSIGSVLNMNFENRSYREARAILNFVQSQGGVVPTTINLPTHVLFNNPFTKYLLTDPKITLSSYNLNNVTVTATRVYNP
jgi:phage-related protein